MNTSLLRHFIKSVTLCAVMPLAVSAQSSFDSGSDGSYGAFSFTQPGTYNVVVPPNGVFNCTTVTVGDNVIIRFQKNASNSPVYLLATGDISLDGTIDINGADSGSNNTIANGGVGGPGGFDGGNGGAIPGDGAGPGGGKGGWSYIPDQKPANVNYRGSGSFASRADDPAQTTSAGPVYGNPLLIPLIGGSGGGGATGDPSYYRGGGGGGGALLIASNTKIVFNPNNTGNSSINANGGYGYGYDGYKGNGSGGSVRLVSPQIVGNAYITVLPYAGSPAYGGFGRIRIDTPNHNSFQLDSDGYSPRYATFGSAMVARPVNFPAVRISQVGDQVIPPDRLDAVFVLLPADSSQTQTVKVKATNYNAVVPLQAVITPANGPRSIYNFVIDNTNGGTTEGSVQVNIPAGVSSRVDVWSH